MKLTVTHQPGSVSVRVDGLVATVATNLDESSRELMAEALRSDTAALQAELAAKVIWWFGTTVNPPAKARKGAVNHGVSPAL